MFVYFFGREDFLGQIIFDEGGKGWYLWKFEEFSLTVGEEF